jgi:hypothetical protein
VSAISERGSTPELPTLGRLGGLSAIEADRGERALWLSGDGYRAALFHLGALTRLNELGLLARIRTVGAMSGGSILAALLATRIPWPLQGPCREWSERVAQPLREIARRNVRARAISRKPFPGAAAEAALEERYARELVESLGGESGPGPHFVFGASGLTLSGIAAGWEECVEWELAGSAHPDGYDSVLVAEVIVAVRTGLDAFGEAEQAALGARTPRPRTQGGWTRSVYARRSPPAPGAGPCGCARGSATAAERGSGRASRRAFTGFAATPGSQGAPRSPAREGQDSQGQAQR